MWHLTEISLVKSRELGGHWHGDLTSQKPIWWLPWKNFHSLALLSVWLRVNTLRSQGWVSLTLLDPFGMDSIKLSRIDSARLRPLKGWFCCIGKFFQLCNLYINDVFLLFLIYYFFSFSNCNISSSSSPYTMLNNCLTLDTIITVSSVSSLNFMLVLVLKHFFPIELKSVYWIITFTRCCILKQKCILDFLKCFFPIVLHNFYELWDTFCMPRIKSYLIG